MSAYLSCLRNAVQSYQARSLDYEKQSDALDNACHAQLASMGLPEPLKLVTELINRLESQSNAKTTMMALHQHFLDCKAQYIPTPNHAWDILYAKVMKKLDEVQRNETDIADLFSSFETDKHLNEISFELADPMQAAFNAIDRAIEQLNHATLSDSAIETVEKWRQACNILAPFIQQQNALTDTLRAAFSSLIPILNGSLARIRVEAAAENNLIPERGQPPVGCISTGQSTASTLQDQSSPSHLNIASRPFTNNW